MRGKVSGGGREEKEICSGAYSRPGIFCNLPTSSACRQSYLFQVDRWGSWGQCVVFKRKKIALMPSSYQGV